jgi:serine/threonine protein kinase
MAPEIINASEYNGYSTEVDVWALGIIMYTLLVG